MTLEFWIALAGALFAGVSALVGFAVVFISLGRWGGRLEGRLTVLELRMNALDRRLDALGTWAKGFSKEVSSLFGVLVQLLHRRQALDDAETELVAQGLANLASPAADALFSQERRSANPLAPEEWQRLRAYVERARGGEWRFTPHEVRDFNALVSVLEQERPEHPGIWPLIHRGAFLQGLTMGAGRQ